MKKINLSTTRCTNPKCKRGIISEVTIKKCPICNSVAVKDKGMQAQAFWGNKDGCIILKDKDSKK